MSVHEVPDREWERFCRWFVENQRGGSIIIRSAGEDGRSASTIARGTLQGMHLARDSSAPELRVVVDADIGPCGEQEEAFGLPALQRLVVARDAHGSAVTVTAESRWEDSLILEVDAHRVTEELPSWLT